MSISTNTTPAKPSRASGYTKSLVREAQGLPLGWRNLTDVDLAQVKRLVQAASDEPDASLRQLETCLLIWAVLTTGREARHLLGCRIHPHRGTGEPTAEGLYRSGADWGWQFVAGAPNAQKRRVPQFADCLREWSKFVVLPAAELIVCMVERCINLRLDDGEDIALGTSRLFSVGPTLIPDATKLLSARNPIGAGRARKATTTLEALARWLPAAIIDGPAGSPVAAALISGRVDRAARTSVHYGSIELKTVIELYRAAVSLVDTLSWDATPSHLLGKFVGDRLSPTDGAVRRLIVRLQDRLLHSGASRAVRHAAMTNYTVALLTFALGHRGERGGIPSSAAVDPDTRFCLIRDKRMSGHDIVRLVWVCDAALDQLRLFDEHLAELEAEGVAVHSMRRGDDLPLFRLGVDGSPTAITIVQAVNEAVRDAGMMPRNAGRHWIGAQLRERCATETLQALFGHGPLDEGCWGAAGGLDPVIYRADLARTLDVVLAGVGWTPCEPPPLRAAA